MSETPPLTEMLLEVGVCWGWEVIFLQWSVLQHVTPHPNQHEVKIATEKAGGDLGRRNLERVAGGSMGANMIKIQHIHEYVKLSKNKLEIFIFPKGTGSGG